MARSGHRASPPGSNLAVASLICGLAGVLLMCPLVFPIGAVLGVVALRDLPTDADRTPRLQAQWGMWIGIIGTVLSALVVGLFAFMIVLGALGAAASA